jgi:asparagine synthase (glutamine-hydrolysing)
VRDFFPRYLDFMEEPGSNPIWMAVYFVARLARDAGVIVALTGDGGDELFAGYDKWMKMLKFHRYVWSPSLSLPGPLRRILAASGGTLAHHRVMSEMLRAARTGEELFQGGTAFKREEVAALVSPEIQMETARSSPYAAVGLLRDRFLESSPDPTDYADWMTYASLKSGLLEDFLMRLDKMGMAASVEGRVPLLDHEFLRLAMSVPGRRKYDGWKRKWLLKGVSTELLPTTLIEAPKRGFNAPVREWIAGEFADMLSDSISTFSVKTGMLTKPGVEKLKREARSDTGVASASWGLMSLALWHEHWIG